MSKGGELYICWNVLRLWACATLARAHVLHYAHYALQYRKLGRFSTLSFHGLGTFVSRTFPGRVPVHRGIFRFGSAGGRKTRNVLLARTGVQLSIRTCWKEKVFCFSVIFDVWCGIIYFCWSFDGFIVDLISCCICSVVIIIYVFF